MGSKTKKIAGMTVSTDMIMMLQYAIGMIAACFFLIMAIILIIVPITVGYNEDETSVPLLATVIFVVTGVQVARLVLLAFTNLPSNYKKWYKGLSRIHASSDVIIEVLMFTLAFALLTIVAGLWFHDARHKDGYTGVVDGEGGVASWMSPNDVLGYNFLSNMVVFLSFAYFYFVSRGALHYAMSEDGNVFNMLPVGKGEDKSYETL